jgi:hypothetical protein
MPTTNDITLLQDAARWRTDREHYEALKTQLEGLDPRLVAETYQYVGRAMVERNHPPVTVRLTRGDNPEMEIQVKLNYPSLGPVIELDGTRISLPSGKTVLVKVTTEGAKPTFAYKRHALAHSLRTILEALLREPELHYDVVISPDFRRCPKVPQSVHSTLPLTGHANDDRRRRHARGSTCDCALPNCCDLCDKDVVLAVDVLYYVEPSSLLDYMRLGRKLLAINWRSPEGDSMCNGECSLEEQEDGKTKFTWTDVGRTVDYVHRIWSTDDYVGLKSTVIASLSGYEFWVLELDTPVIIEDYIPTSLVPITSPFPPIVTSRRHSTCSLASGTSVISTASRARANSLYADFLRRTGTGYSGEEMTGRQVVQRVTGQPAMTMQRMLYELVPKFYDDPADGLPVVHAIIAHIAHKAHEARVYSDENTVRDITGNDAFVRNPAAVPEQMPLVPALWRHFRAWWKRRTCKFNAKVYKVLTGEDLPLQVPGTH